LPVEVVAFGHKSTAARIAVALSALGYGEAGMMVLRQRGGVAFVTDSGNFIYDISLGVIADAPKLATALSAIPGVVEHGLFIGFASTLLIAGPGGVKVIERS
jgi:ribose 5-phosphate isomerase A